MESFSEDTLFNITSYLTSHEILNLALTCKHFGGKPGGVDVSSKKRKTKRRKNNNKANIESSMGRQWSLMEEMARRRVEDIKKDTNWQEKWKGTDVYKLTSRTGNESWLKIDNCLQKMNSELVFSQFIGNSFGYVKKNPSHIQMKRYTDDTAPVTNSIAICQDIMTEGRHYVEYTVTRDGPFSPGIIYPIQNCHEAELVKGIPWDTTLNPCTTWTGIMSRYTSVCNSQEWNASCSKFSFHFDTDGPYDPYKIYPQQKGTVGVLLDFNKDTMQLFYNGRCLVTHCGRYSGGQYSWGVLLDNSLSYRGAVKIERKPPPVEVRVVEAPPL